MAPQKISETLGAEILRLWVGSTDYSGELFISQEILNRVVESYRRIRNTLRFLLANTSDFDSALHTVRSTSGLRSIVTMLCKTAMWQGELQEYFEKYEFHDTGSEAPVLLH